MWHLVVVSCDGAKFGAVVRHQVLLQTWKISDWNQGHAYVGLQGGYHNPFLDIWVIQVVSGGKGAHRGQPMSQASVNLTNGRQCAES